MYFMVSLVALKLNSTDFIFIGLSGVIFLTMVFLLILKGKQHSSSLEQLNSSINKLNNDMQKKNMSLIEKDELTQLLKTKLNDLTGTMVNFQSLVTSFMDNTRIQMWVVDAEGVFLNCNKVDTYSAVLKEKDAKGKSLSQFFGAQINPLLKNIVGVIKNNEPRDNQLFKLSKDDKTYWYMSDLFPLSRSGKKYCLAFIYDYTYDKELEYLKEYLSDNIDSGLIIVQDNEYKFFNRKWCEISGYKREELKSFVEDYYFSQPYKPVMSDEIFDDDVKVYETYLKVKNEAPVLVTLKKISLQFNRRPAGLFLINRMDEQDKKEAELNENMTIYKSTIEYLEQAIIVIDSEGVIINYNKRMSELWNISDTMLKTFNWDKLIKELNKHIDSKNSVINMDNFQTSLIPESKDYEITLKNGKIFKIMCNPFTFNTINAGRICTFTDITEIAKKQRDLSKAKNEAENVSMSKTEYVASMSHEIRTPMNGIIGVTTLLERTNLDIKQKRYVDIVKVSANSLLDLVNDILDLSKIEAGYLKLEEIEFDLLETIGSVTDILALKAQSKKIEFLNNVKPDVPTTLLGDPSRIRQILINLGNNAIKFTEKGEIAITCDLDKLDGENCNLHFAVIDSGVGIKPDKIDSIFKSYEQEDDSTSRKFGGTGLGLSICKKLTKLMQGDIWAVSEVGKGSEFHFTIKVKAKKQQPADMAYKELMNLKKNVLIIASNETNAKFLNSTLTHFGFNTKVKNTVEDLDNELLMAVRMDEPYDLLLTDIFTGENDTLKQIEIIRLFDDLNYLKIIFMATFEESAELEVTPALDVTAVISKPIKRSELLDAIGRAFQINLPLKEEVAPLSKSTMPTLPQTNGESYHILLAEDNIVNQGVIAELIESEGHQVITAEDGQKVLDYLKEKEFDFIFMDVHMPVLDGYETTRKIREMEKITFKHIPIIALTADIQEEDRNRCLESGMDDFLIKPIRMDDMKAVIKRVMYAPPPELTATKPAPIVVNYEIDMNYIYEKLGDNAKVILKTFNLISKSFPTNMRDIRTAMVEGDAAALHRAAHGMKGFMNYFDLPNVMKLIMDLERAGKENDLSFAKIIMIDLEPQLNGFLKALKAKVEELSR